MKPLNKITSAEVLVQFSHTFIQHTFNLLVTDSFQFLNVLAVLSSSSQQNFMMFVYLDHKICMYFYLNTEHR